VLFQTNREPSDRLLSEETGRGPYNNGGQQKASASRVEAWTCSNFNAAAAEHQLTDSLDAAWLMPAPAP
jgi:hypothetical protein